MSLGGIDGGGNVKEWARVPILGRESDPPQEGKYGKHIAGKHQEWPAKLIGPHIYQVAMMMIQRDIGNDSDGRKPNSRGDADDECGSVAVVDGEAWGSIAVIDWFLALK